MSCSDEEFAKRLRSIRISGEFADSNEMMGAVDIVAFGAGLRGFDSPMGWTLISNDRLQELKDKAGEL